MARTGRPRAKGPSPSGLGSEQDLLVAAARLFCHQGYSSVSTHRIAAEAGLSQASMYHYFASKKALLLALLVDTVRPSLRTAAWLAERPEPAAERLWALCADDVTLLLGGADNLGALYLLPEIDDPAFAEFHRLRAELYDAYRVLVAECLASDTDGAHPTAALVFGMVESVILRRRAEPDLPSDEVAPQVADAVLRVLGTTDPAAAAGVTEAGGRLRRAISTDGGGSVTRTCAGG